MRRRQRDAAHASANISDDEIVESPTREHVATGVHQYTSRFLACHRRVSARAGRKIVKLAVCFSFVDCAFHRSLLQCGLFSRVIGFDCSVHVWTFVGRLSVIRNAAPSRPRNFKPFCSAPDGIVAGGVLPPLLPEPCQHFLTFNLVPFHHCLPITAWNRSTLRDPSGAFRRIPKCASLYPRPKSLGLQVPWCGQFV